MPWLAAGLTEGRGAYQGLPRVRPAIGMCVMSLVPLQRGTQRGRKVDARTTIPPFEATACSDTAPQLDLVEPRAREGRQREDLCRRGIPQEGAALGATLPGLGRPGKRTPRGDQTANVQTPVGIEVIEDPVLAGHLWQVGDHGL
jgi:hypothetical protein